MKPKTDERVPAREAPLLDPLGLKAMDAVVAELRSAAAGSSAPEPARWRELVGRLDAAHGEMGVRMGLLRDRYQLLKRSSAQLADELAWLRDQLDDLRSAESAPAPLASGAADEGRRYSDRWK
jgi:hypothetical protein